MRTLVVGVVESLVEAHHILPVAVVRILLLVDSPVGAALEVVAARKVVEDMENDLEEEDNRLEEDPEEDLIAKSAMLLRRAERRV